MGSAPTPNFYTHRNVLLLAALQLSYETVPSLAFLPRSATQGYLEFCEERSKAAGGDLSAMLDALFEALNGSTREGSGVTGAVAESGTPASGCGGTRSMKRSRTALLAKPKDDENEAEAPDPDDAAEASAAGGDAAPISAAGNGGCFEDASETPGKPLEVTEKEGGRIPLMQTDHVSTPNRGALEYDNDYQGAGYDASARDIEALLNRMAEERLEVKRTSRLNELAQNISYGDIHEGIKITVHRMTSVSDTLRDRYPQAFGAVVHRAQEMTSISRTFVIDIGGYTSDVLLLRKGKPDMEFCRSLNMGVITMTNHIAGKVNSLYDISVDDEHICEILAGQNTVLDGEIQKAIRGEVEKYAADMLNKLRELQVDLRTNPAIFVGGGSILLRAFIKASAFVSAVEFEPDTRANAYGYELLGQAQLEKLARRAGSAI